MRYPPLSVILSWPTPNYVDPVTRGPALLGVELTVLPVALVCVALRLFIRIHWLRRSWWDDWLMVGAAVVGIGLTVCVVLASQLYGWDIHVWDLTLHQIIKGRQVSIAGQTLFCFASGLVKLSILTSYLRIAPPKSLFRRLDKAAIVLVTIHLFVFLIVLWTQCKPLSAYWDLTLANENDCEPEGPPVLSQAITTCVLDFITYVLPMPTLFQLRLPLLQRMVLMILFGFGGIAVVACCMRTYWIYHVIYETYDVTWEGFDMWIWTAVEVNLGVICGCIPSLKPLFWPSRPHPGGSSGRTVTIGGTGPRQRNVKETWDFDIEAEDEDAAIPRKPASIVPGPQRQLSRGAPSPIDSWPATTHSFLLPPSNGQSASSTPPALAVALELRESSETSHSERPSPIEQPPTPHWLATQKVDWNRANRESNIKLPLDGTTWSGRFTEK